MYCNSWEILLLSKGDQNFKIIINYDPRLNFLYLRFAENQIIVEITKLVTKNDMNINSVTLIINN